MAETTINNRGLVKYSGFLGTNNIDDSHAVDSKFLVKASNFHLDKYGHLHTREGRTRVLTGDFKSVWADKSIILSVLDGNLVKINKVGTSYSSTLLLAGVGGDSDMEYVRVGSKIYFTNNSVIGYIEGNSASLLSAPAAIYKMVMPPGHLIEYYNGILYVAVNDMVVASDAYGHEMYDERNDPLRLEGRITLMKSVDDGMYLSDGINTYFALGGSPQKWVKRTISNYGVEEGSGYKSSAITVGGKYYSNAVMWNTPHGICVGGNSGEFVNLTELRFLASNAQKSFGFIIRGTINQYLCILKN